MEKKLIGRIFKNNFILAFSIAIFCSCASNQTNNNLRANAIPPSKILENSIRLEKVESQYKGIKKEIFVYAITKSLDGNNYLGEQDKYLLNATIIKGNVTNGLTNTADISIKYELIDSLTGDLAWSNQIDSTATAAIKLNLLSIIFKSIGDAALGFPTMNKGDVVFTDYEKTDPKMDAEFGYPPLGTPINAKDGLLRQQYAINTALRKNFV